MIAGIDAGAEDFVIVGEDASVEVFKVFAEVTVSTDIAPGGSTRSNYSG